MNKCEKCGKSFSRSDSLRRHEREVCGVTKKRKCEPVVTSPSKRTKRDEQFKRCVTCNIDISSKDFASHLKTQNHKNKSCTYTEKAGVYKIDCAFKNRIVTYRVVPSKKYRDFEEFFKDLQGKITNLINEEIEKHRSIKINMCLYASYILQTQEIQETKSFNSKNKILTLTSSNKKYYGDFKEELITKASEFEANGSGKSRSFI